MTDRMSSKERIRQMADEAAAGAEQKVEKKAKKTSSKKEAATIKQNKIVWKVFDAGYKEKACFPFSEKEKAYATAEDLSKKSNRNYFVNDVSVPMES
ncbi:MAG: hypothetical protein ACUZ8O_12635 [Candidatus Anammoxibacter sp.]